MTQQNRCFCKPTLTLLPAGWNRLSKLSTIAETQVESYKSLMTFFFFVCLVCVQFGVYLKKEKKKKQVTVFR